MLTRVSWVVLLCCTATMLVLGGAGMAQNNNCSIERGIAAKYLGDQGIEKDPDVVFTENFEESSLSDVFSRWSSVKDEEFMSFSKDVPSGSSGGQSLQITSIGPYLFAYLYKNLSPADDDRLYLRYYVKYSSDVIYHHSGAVVGGYNPPTNWPQGGAGERPAGYERFTVGFEPRNTALRADFYTYWKDMRRAQDGSFWGNEFVSDSNVRLSSEDWTCVEIMVKLNDPDDASNGELALWLNGRLVTHLGEAFPNGNWSAERFLSNEEGEPFEGFQWRTTEDLRFNFIQLLDYITQDQPGNVGMVWYDDLVLARNYIGPINTQDPKECSDFVVGEW